MKELIGDEYFDPEPRYSGTVAKFMSRMKCMIRNPEKQDGEPPRNEVTESDGDSEAPDVSPEVTKKEEVEPPENEVAQLERDSLDVPEKQEVEPHGEEVREPDDVGPDVPDKQESEPPEKEVADHDVGLEVLEKPEVEPPEKDDTVQDDIDLEVPEVQDRMESWKRKRIRVNYLYHWPGVSYVADLPTKGRAEGHDVVEGSEWQDGPVETRYPVNQWPINRNFVQAIPEQEKGAAAEEES